MPLSMVLGCYVEFCYYMHCSCSMVVTLRVLKLVWFDLNRYSV